MENERRNKIHNKNNNTTNNSIYNNNRNDKNSKNKLHKSITISIRNNNNSSIIYYNNQTTNTNRKHNKKKKRNTKKKTNNKKIAGNKMTEEIQVYNNITQKEIEEALADEKTPSTKRWNIISSMEGNKEFKKAKDKIKNGIKIKFDIRNITKGYIQEEPQFNIAKIARTQEENIQEYWDEIEEREKIMKTILRNQIDESFDKQTETTNTEYDEET